MDSDFPIVFSASACDADREHVFFASRSSRSRSRQTGPILIRSHGLVARELRAPCVAQQSQTASAAWPDRTITLMINCVICCIHVRRRCEPRRRGLRCAIGRDKFIGLQSNNQRGVAWVICPNSTEICFI